jgi:hypothetical protein
MYADQASGLGPELVRMDAWPGDWRGGRWIDHVEEWQRGGSPGGKPPGVRDLAPPVQAGEPRDYFLQVGTYLSRPEVLFFFASPVPLLCWSADFVVYRRWKACL